MVNLDAVRQHLERNLANHSTEEVIGYLEKWASPGRELSLMLSGNYIQYPALSDITGQREDSGGIALPWIFNSPEAADQFCVLVESTFRIVGARCLVAGRGH